MKGKVKRVSAEGLRTSDPTVLSILIQDLLHTPIDKLSALTLCDLIALSETEGLPRSMGRDLGRFRERMVRAYADIPDGPLLTEFFQRMAEVEAQMVPTFWRDAVAAREDILSAPTAALDGLRAAWAQAEPKPVVLTSRPVVRVQRDERVRGRESISRATRKATPTKSAGRKRAVRAPAHQRDVRREQWIREDVISRLKSYGSRGLSQAILVAGSQHRAPWNDLGEDEVLSTLRKMAKEGSVKYSAGRWSARGRGW